MANMSYCRFRNTLRDLIDCLSAIQEIVDNDGVNEYVFTGPFGNGLKKKEFTLTQEQIDSIKSVFDVIIHRNRKQSTK